MAAHLKDVDTRQELLDEFIVPSLQPHFSFKLSGKTRVGDRPSKGGLGLDDIGLSQYEDSINLWLYPRRYPNVTLPELEKCDTLADVANLVGDKMDLPPPSAE